MSINILISKWDLDVMDKIFPSWLDEKIKDKSFIFSCTWKCTLYGYGIIDFIPPQFDGLNDLHFQGLILDSQGGVC